MINVITMETRRRESCNPRKTSDSSGRMVHAGRNAKEILIPKIFVTALGDYTRNVGYKTDSITYEYETHSLDYDRVIRLFADVIDVMERDLRIAYIIHKKCCENCGDLIGVKNNAASRLVELVIDPRAKSGTSPAARCSRCNTTRWSR